MLNISTSAADRCDRTIPIHILKPLDLNLVKSAVAEPSRRARFHRVPRHCSLACQLFRQRAGALGQVTTYEVELFAE